MKACLYYMFSMCLYHIDRDNLNLHYVWQYFAVTKHTNAKEDWAKNAFCNFMTKASVNKSIPEQQHIF